MVRPIQAFFELEAASGIVLLACATAALVWVNLAGAQSYRALVEAPISVMVGGAAVRFTLLQLVNDGLMTVFFFVVGMEIKRELVVGELAAPSQAALPAVAALGGMIAPAALFLAWNAGRPGEPGWGVPMATDIAFTVGVLALLGKRVPPALVVFVTALAIFDDIGGILVIAVFYGGALDARWLAAAAALTALLAAFSARRVRSGTAYLAVGALLWYALHASGIHATIAGVALGLAIPARGRSAPREILEALARDLADVVRRPPAEADDEGCLLAAGDRIEELEAPLDRFERRLHPWVAFGVMPLFALVNSGVDLRGLAPGDATGNVAVGVAVALLAGKPIGIFAFTVAAVKLGFARVPGDASLVKLLGVSVVAGIGFTVALFIAGLAYASHPDLLDQAKLGILAGSLTSGLAGALIIRLTPPADG